MLSALKQYLPDYEKGQTDVFALLNEQLDFALANAARSLDEAQRNNIDNPSTKVHKLVTFMRNLKMTRLKN